MIVEGDVVEWMEDYRKKAEKAEIMLCDSHALEYFSFETCPACEREERETKEEEQQKMMAKREAMKILWDVESLVKDE